MTIYKFKEGQFYSKACIWKILHEIWKSWFPLQAMQDKTSYKMLPTPSKMFVNKNQNQIYD
jgi:hypothetical protein